MRHEITRDANGSTVSGPDIFEGYAMRNASPKRRRRNAEAKPVRDQLRADVLRCERCGTHRGRRDVHEIARGVNRAKALDKRFALLLLCLKCHYEFGNAALWPEARQLALLRKRRPADFDLVAYLELTNPRAPERITMEEISAWLDHE